MKPNTTTRSRNRIAQLVVAGSILAALSCTLYVMSQSCPLFHALGWAAFELARPVISAVLQSVSAHLCGPSLSQHVLQTVASNWPLLSALAS
jgi:hypothetical protein